MVTTPIPFHHHKRTRGTRRAARVSGFPMVLRGMTSKTRIQERGGDSKGILSFRFRGRVETNLTKEARNYSGQTLIRRIWLRCFDARGCRRIGSDVLGSFSIFMSSAAVAKLANDLEDVYPNHRSTCVPQQEEEIFGGQ
jgi:hypothetical protein